MPLFASSHSHALLTADFRLLKVRGWGSRWPGALPNAMAGRLPCSAPDRAPVSLLPFISPLVI